jgi:hypothetical protein
MNGDNHYIPSETLPGKTELVRERSFTRWMSRDLLQAATQFCNKMLGLASLYSESAAGGVTRYLFWRPPQGTGIEVRSGRKLDQFKKFDEANVERGWPLLSLHVSEDGTYSAVWISPNQYQTGKSLLGFYGITPAERLAH